MQMDETERARIREIVEQRMHSFEAAERALDAEALIRHFSPDPGFYIYNDGNRLTYEAMTAGVRQAFPAMRSIEGGFGDMDVLVLAPDVALATARFEETVTDGSGNVTRQRGAASWLWRQVGSEWRIVYGHVDHHAEPSAE